MKAKGVNNKGEYNVVINMIKTLIVVFLICVQIYLMYLLISSTAFVAQYATGLVEIIKIIMVLYIVYKYENPSYKIAWIIVIVFIPVAGILLYLLWGNSKLSKKNMKKIKKIYENTKDILKDDDEIYEEIKKQDKIRYNQIKYIKNMTTYPIYRNETCKYLEMGESYFESILEDMKNAKKYILLEYYIIAHSKMWDKILEVLKDKVANGVKIYIITDQFGSILRYPKNFKKDLIENKINFVIFNPVTPILSTYINYRDHRKITVIDGEIAYTGGINIGDEYINVVPKLGRWKDTGIRVTGDVVQSYVVMFFRMWQYSNNDDIDYNQFIVKNDNALTINNTKGYTLFYGDGPDNLKNPAESLYLQLINTAKDYIYITTPYLILSNEFVTALLTAARSGIDVRIITPYVADKWFVHIVTTSFYQILIEAGVKIYEYKPGFIHSKMFIVDDEIATVGSINLDFRSLYLNFECGTLIYKTGTEVKIKEDFLNTQKESIEILEENWKKRSIIKHWLEAILKIFAPLL